MDKKLSKLQKKLRVGEISRREFIRSTLLLGVSLSVAEILAACEPQGTQRPTPTSRFQAFIPDTDNIVPTPVGGVIQIAEPTPAQEATPTIETVPSPTALPRKKIKWLCASCGKRLQTEE